jgi:hypothetical protein
MKKADILKQRRVHRGDPEALALNFLLNYSAPARLMHSFLPPRQDKEDILQAAIRAYIIGIAACTETFFRDLYLHMLRLDPGSVPRALDQNGLRVSLRNLPQYIAEGLSAEEFASAQVSFQSAEAINRNFSIFFSAKPFFDVLDDFELVCVAPSARRRGPARLKLSPGWQPDLIRVFSLRHEFAHDANSKTQIEANEMRSIETTVLVLCQVTAHLPAINLKVIRSEGDYPAILLIADLISEDWEVAEDLMSPETE